MIRYLFCAFLFCQSLCYAADEIKQEAGIVQTLVKTSEYLPTLENVGGILGASVIVGTPLYLSSFLSGCTMNSLTDELSALIFVFTFIPAIMVMWDEGDKKRMLSTGALTFCCFLPILLYTGCTTETFVDWFIKGIPHSMGLN